MLCRPTLISCSLQVQVHLNTDVVDHVVHDQQTPAAQVDATGKAVAKLTLERMARDLEDYASSHFGEPSLHRVPVDMTRMPENIGDQGHQSFPQVEFP